MDAAKRIEELKLVPVVKLNSAGDAAPVAEALCKGGLPVAEVTFRTLAALESIRIMRDRFPQMLTGAGTVVNVEQAEKAFEAGAQFIVSPGMSRAVIEFALGKGIPVYPGACTPTEIMTAMEYGLEIVKFFPAKQYGGLETIKALAGPFPSVRFMPTGGISQQNLKEHLACEKIVACGGSWMVNEGDIKAGNFDRVRELTAEAVSIIKGPSCHR